MPFVRMALKTFVVGILVLGSMASSIGCGRSTDAKPEPLLLIGGVKVSGDEQNFVRDALYGRFAQKGIVVAPGSKFSVDCDSKWTSTQYATPRYREVRINCHLIDGVTPTTLGGIADHNTVTAKARLQSGSDVELADGAALGMAEKFRFILDEQHKFARPQK